MSTFFSSTRGFARTRDVWIYKYFVLLKIAISVYLKFTECSLRKLKIGLQVRVKMAFRYRNLMESVWNVNPPTVKLTLEFILRNILSNIPILKCKIGLKVENSIASMS